jgi:hypothetical protein
MFTYRDFEMGTLGLAWTGDLKNAGGVCEKNGVSVKILLFFRFASNSNIPFSIPFCFLPLVFLLLLLFWCVLDFIVSRFIFPRFSHQLIPRNKSPFKRGFTRRHENARQDGRMYR